jgi:2-(1,2-epoxy-1,2-dihydrophenyl)acetyl-CoA isomerase
MTCNPKLLSGGVRVATQAVRSASMGELTTIRWDVADGIGTLTMNRPDRLNGMTNRMLIEAAELLTYVATEDSVKVVVLTGAGRGFCPGADLKHYTEGGSEPGATGDQLRPDHFRVPVLLHEMPQVTVAAINGACAGAGLGWAAACDLRVAARSATFNTAFLAVAVAGDMGLPWTLPRLVGAAKARELSFLPGKFSADEALGHGLVSRVWDDDVFRDEVDRLAHQLAGSAPLALRGLKANYLAAEKVGLAELVELESERHLRISASRDTREAFAAFVEKRTPSFEGR